MTGVADRAERRLDVIPATFVLQPTADEFRDERTALALAGSSIKLGDERVIHRYVQSHVPNIAHRLRDIHREPVPSNLHGPGWVCMCISAFGQVRSLILSGVFSVRHRHCVMGWTGRVPKHEPV